MRYTLLLLPALILEQNIFAYGERGCLLAARTFRPNREEIEKQAGGIHGQKKKAPYMEKVNITGNNS